MPRRKLTQEELNLWKRVADQTEPRKPPKKAFELPPVLPVAKYAPRDAAPVFAVPRSAKPDMPTVRYDLVNPMRQRLETAPVRMDHKAFRKMKRGKLKPEARIDLHGITLARAHPALTRFILSSVASGKRLVLVITGKGRDRDDGALIPVPRGILRHHLPHWLTAAPLASHVIQFTPAHISHGGEGACYIYLRRAR